MKKILVIYIVLFSILGCTDEDKNKSTVKENISKPALTETATSNDGEIVLKFEESTYDRTDLKDRIENHKIALASLSNNGIFKLIGDPLLKELRLLINSTFPLIQTTNFYQWRTALFFLLYKMIMSLSSLIRVNPSSLFSSIKQKKICIENSTER